MRKIRDLGLKELTILGLNDPLCFKGWEKLKLLQTEIEILEENIEHIDYNNQIKVRWFENLMYCLDTLIKSVPKDSIPRFMIGIMALKL